MRINTQIDAVIIEKLLDAADLYDEDLDYEIRCSTINSYLKELEDDGNLEQVVFNYFP